MRFDADTSRLILDNVERFCRERVRARAAEIDRSGEFPRDLFAEAAKLGLFGLGIVEEYGGLGRDLITPLLISERLARDSASFALIYNNTTDSTVPIAECDLVVLPYSVERYRARGSGILAECLALGVPVTAPVGTLPGRIIEQTGVGPLFIANTLGPIYQAIKAAELNYSSFAAKAHRFARHFCVRNGVAQFASALLAAAGPSNFPKTRRP